MPVYVYGCDSCKTQYSELRRMKDIEVGVGVKCSIKGCCGTYVRVPTTSSIKVVGFNEKNGYSSNEKKIKVPKKENSS